MNKVTMKGNELHLEGDFPQTGSQMKAFKLLANNMAVKTNNDYAKKALIILTVPSIDTGVCDMEVRKFNEAASKLSDDIRIITVSTDLPFAQGRWCAAAGISKVETLSDHLTADFGKSYGVLIKELRLLARSVLVYDKSGKLIYSELVKETTNEPDYVKALEAAKKSVA